MRTQVWRDGLGPIPGLSVRESRFATRMFWRGRAWDLSPRRLFACVEPLLRTDPRGVAALFMMGPGRRSLLELHLNSSRWLLSWMDDVATRRDFFLSFYLTRDAVRELKGYREDTHELSRLTIQVRLALPCLGMGGHDLLAATSEITPYDADWHAYRIKDYESELARFEYDEELHEDNDRFDETEKGQALIFLPEATAILRGVSRLWAWNEPDFGPLATWIHVPPHLECETSRNHMNIECEGPDHLLADLLGLEFYGYPDIEPGWGPPGEGSGHDMDMAPLASALRYFYHLLGASYTASIIREIVGGYDRSWSKGVRFRVDFFFVGAVASNPL